MHQITNFHLIIIIKYFFVKVAVNSGGRHCLALSSNGEVYAWGDGDDGKLGLGNRKLVNSIHYIILQKFI